MRKITIALLISSVLLFFGCASNTPDLSQYQHSQKLIHANGKKYLVPRNSVQHFVVSKEREKLFKHMQVSCKQGDMHWSTKKAQDTMAILHKKESDGDKGLSYYGLQRLHESGLMGCATVMTSKQKKAYLRESEQKQAMIYERLNYMAYKKQSRTSTRNYNSFSDLNTVDSNPVNLDDQDKGYISSSGQRYKYDLTKPTDRVMYSADPVAQINDQVNPMIGIDRSLGQYGGGSYMD